MIYKGILHFHYKTENRVPKFMKQMVVVGNYLNSSNNYNINLISIKINSKELTIY